ncbi:MAG: hypothetical protein JXA69_20735 [Phycisphaerae bacterium]|nr:hypothetical protein [Phycisphaerae bacterium]
MDGGESPLIDPAIFHNNIAALKGVDAALADRLAGLAIPDSVEPCHARDGEATFRIRDADGRTRWFGGSSVPTASAAGLVSSFDAGTGNVLLHGIGHGTVVTLLLRALEPYRGVVVLETDPLAVALALRLHDYADALRSRRLVLVLGQPETLESEFTTFLRTNEGYLCPERLLVWPWQTPNDSQQLQAIVERSRNVVYAERSEALAALQRQRPAASAEPFPESPRVAVVALAASPDLWDWADEVVEAGRTLGWTTGAVLVRGPGDCHAVRLARQVADVGPDWVLALRASRSELGTVVGQDVPIVTWLDVPGGWSAERTQRLGPHDFVSVTSESLKETLRQGGVPARQMAVLPHAGGCADAVANGAKPREFDVAVLMDLASPDPAAAGITQQTHQMLWCEAAKLIRREIDSFTTSRGGAVVSAAEEKLKLALRDAGVRAKLAQGIGTLLGPALIAAELVRRLCAAGLRVHIWGTGWPAYGVEGPDYHGPLPAGDALRTTLGNTKLYVNLGCSGQVGRAALIASALGAVIVWRRHPADRTAGGVAVLMEEGTDYVAFRSADELVRTCLGMLKNENSRNKTADSAKNRHHGNHRMPDRLCQLIANIRPRDTENG